MQLSTRRKFHTDIIMIMSEDEVIDFVLSSKPLSKLVQRLFCTSEFVRNVV